MPFNIDNGHGEQLTAGTHGLYSNSGATTAIGRLDGTGGRETWHWKATTFSTSTFYLKILDTPATTARSPGVWDYPDQTLDAEANVTPVTGTTWKIKRSGGAHVGYLVLKNDDTLNWYILKAEVTNNRITTTTAEILTFESYTTTLTADNYRKCSSSRIGDMP